MRPRITRPRWLLLAVGLLVSSVSSCGDGRPKAHPVSGQVLYNGEPLAGVTVAFHPTDPKNNTGMPPNGKTDESGKFKLTTFIPNDGCPAGEWKVAIAFEAEAVDDGSDQSKKVTFQVPKKYHRAETTDLSATIKSGDNPLEPFRLQGPPRPRGKR